MPVGALTEKLELIGMSLSFFIPELILAAGIFLLIVIGLIKKKNASLLTFACLAIFCFFIFLYRYELVSIQHTCQYF